jgi:hypothetical protein
MESQPPGAIASVVAIQQQWPTRLVARCGSRSMATLISSIGTQGNHLNSPMRAVYGRTYRIPFGAKLSM